MAHFGPSLHNTGPQGVETADVRPDRQLHGAGTRGASLECRPQHWARGTGHAGVLGLQWARNVHVFGWTTTY